MCFPAFLGSCCLNAAAEGGGVLLAVQEDVFAGGGTEMASASWRGMIKKFPSEKKELEIGLSHVQCEPQGKIVGEQFLTNRNSVQR
jgi:hypothetical protein